MATGEQISISSDYEVKFLHSEVVRGSLTEWLGREIAELLHQQVKKEEDIRESVQQVRPQILVPSHGLPADVLHKNSKRWAEILHAYPCKYHSLVH